MNTEQKHEEGVRLFRKFKSEIIPAVITESGISYENVNTLGDTWRDKIPYDVKLEEFLIKQTNRFVFLYVKSKDLKFLKTLIHGFADYLSVYTLKSHKFSTRRQHCNALMDSLYTQSPHIRYIIAVKNTQEEAHEDKLNRPQKTPSAKKTRARINQIDIQNEVNKYNNAQMRFNKSNGRQY